MVLFTKLILKPFPLLCWLPNYRPEYQKGISLHRDLLLHSFCWGTPCKSFRSACYCTLDNCLLVKIFLQSLHCFSHRWFRAPLPYNLQWCFVFFDVFMDFMFKSIINCIVVVNSLISDSIFSISF